MSSESETDSNNRREFFKKALAVTLGTASAAIPAAAGLAVLFDPVRRKTDSGNLIKVANLADLAPEGIPKRFKVLSTRIDAWTRHNESPIGAVFLIRKGPETVEAFHVTCPHAGCAVEYMPEGPGWSGAAKEPCYFCPCHNSTFALDGSVNDPKSPSPRGLDSLEVVVRGEEVLVKFQNYLAGKKVKIPIS
jgi:menaquinol-cytochrome c reductase iron-sulfur subunit